MAGEEERIREVQLVRVKSVGVSEMDGKFGLSVDAEDHGLLVLALDGTLLASMRTAIWDLLRRLASGTRGAVTDTATVEHANIAIKDGNQLFLALDTDKWGRIALRMGSRETLLEMRAALNDMIAGTAPRSSEQPKSTQ
jgi:hypothetical protein